MRLILLSAFSAALFTACSSQPPASAPVANAAATPAPAAKSQAPAGTAAPVASKQALPAYLDPSNPIYQQRSVYFDFDNAAFRREYVPVIERHGQYLSHNPALKITVEGNADERGSSEYNLALGNRRAQAVKSALQVYGVKDAQVEAVSLGKERPKATGHDETAWAQNRRADIVYPNQ